MGDLTRNLSRSEITCECGCGFDTIDFALVEALQDAVFYFEKQYGKKVILQITGGNRCEKHNSTIEGASENSQHIYGKAVDHKFWIVEEDGARTQIAPDIVFAYYGGKYESKFGIGRYGNRTHLDSRTNRARW